MSGEFFNKLAEMRQGSEPFATAYVVRRQSPSSGKPGDKAVVDHKGRIYGWIGGGCTKGIILKEALEAIRDGKPRLVSISSHTEKPGSRPGVKYYDMTCQSKGSVDVYVEPVLPKPRILVLGNSHIAAALVKLCRYMDYAVSVVGEDVDRERFKEANSIVTYHDIDNGNVTSRTCIVVCTQGEGDELALQTALATNAGYIAFVSSRIKANAVFNTLRMMGVETNDLKRVKTPAGLDINAKLANEVAVSIMAQIISFIRSEDTAGAEHNSEKGEESNVMVPEGYYLNPVCDIPVQISTAKHVLDYKGQNVYFCCDGCKIAFEDNPAKYMEPAGA